MWRDYGASADAARIKHGYDRAGNRLWREDPVAAANSKDFDELYAYDGLYRLSDFQRGNLNSTKDAIASGTLNFAQDWGFDPLGNWLTFDEDSDGDGTPDLVQTREFNKVNEITDIDNGGWVVPAYDRNGNMTTVPQPAAPTSSYTATYDAWNRLMSLSDGSNTVAEYQYDGQKWRTVTKSYSGGSLSETRHHYYSQNWQCLEERVGSSSNADRQFVWGLRYIDDLVLRDRDTNADGSLDERLYALQDPNWNVIAIADTSGDVQERYLYSAYGQHTVLDASFAGASPSFGWETLYAGYRHDAASGLMKLRYRFLHLQGGLFAQRDRAESTPNLYQYAFGAPMNWNDPDGLQVRPAPTPRPATTPRPQTPRTQPNRLDPRSQPTGAARGTPRRDRNYPFDPQPAMPGGPPGAPGQPPVTSEPGIDRNELQALQALAHVLTNPTRNPCDAVGIPCNVPLNARRFVTDFSALPLPGIQAGRYVPFLGVMKICQGHQSGTAPDMTAQAMTRQFGLAGDQAGHLIAQRFGGPGEYSRHNIVPMSRLANNSGFQRAENRAAGQVGPGCPVCIIVLADYNVIAYDFQRGQHLYFRPSDFIYWVFGQGPPSVFNINN